MVYLFFLVPVYHLSATSVVVTTSYEAHCPMVEVLLCCGLPLQLSLLCA